MKIWTITTDDNTGHTCNVFYTAAAADAAALEVCRKDWPKDEGPCPDNWRDAMEVIEDGDGLLMWVEEHDISDHPAIASAHHAFDAMEDQIGDSETAACNDETMELIWEGKRNLTAAIGGANANQSQLWTVIFMLPHHWREDQPCAADEVIRVWVAADSADAAPEAARAILHTQTELGDTSPDLFATVAVYPGHIFDHFQP
jgi:hypothetical protein